MNYDLESEARMFNTVFGRHDPIRSVWTWAEPRKNQFHLLTNLRAHRISAQQSGPKKPEKKTAKESKLAAQQAKQQALDRSETRRKATCQISHSSKGNYGLRNARTLGLNAAIAAQTLRNLEAKNAIQKSRRLQWTLHLRN